MSRKRLKLNGQKASSNQWNGLNEEIDESCSVCVHMEEKDSRKILQT